jgi:DNA polymerase
VDALVMLVGEAPGRQEDLRGEPFVGAAGRFLDGLLESVGLTRDQVYITNVVKSRPFVGPRPGRNRPPAPGEIDACRSWLDEQIELVRPEIVVAMGRVALEYFFPKTMLSEVHGRPLRRDGRTVLPTLHPAVHRWPRWRAILVGDFKALGALLGTSVRDTAGRSGRKPPPQRRKEAPQPSQK